MDLILWYKLGTYSRRALKREKGRFGRPYHYSPRGDLLTRLSRETGWSISDVYSQLLKEREYLLRKM